MALNPATASYVDSLVKAREAEYTLLRIFRDYADGDHTDYMTGEQRILLVGEDGAGNPNTAPELRLNICATVLDAETDRLEVKSVVITADDNEALSDELSTLAWNRWKRSRMDEGQQNVNYAASRDGNAGLMAWWDDTAQQARLSFNKAYDGDSSGAEWLYQDDDPAQPICAVKIWTVERPVIGNANVGRVQRKNVYYDDRVEKYINRNADGTYAAAGWRPLVQGDPDYEAGIQTGTFTDVMGSEYTATFNWWTDTSGAGGAPLGIPLIHFRHQARGSAYGRSSLADIAPGLQDTINMTDGALLAATMLSGSKVTFATNFDPSTNTISVFPGAIIYNTQEGGFGQLQESNLLQLIEVLNHYIKLAATLTSTPLSFFNLTGQVAAEGTQKQLESALLAKTRRNQTSLGNAYEDAIRMLLKLEAVFGNEVGLSLEEIDALDIAIEWEDAQVRNEREVAELAILRHEKLHTPIDVAWSEAGYNADEIEAMREDYEVRRNQAMGALVEQLAGAGQVPPPNGLVPEAAEGRDDGNQADAGAGQADSATRAPVGAVAR